MNNLSDYNKRQYLNMWQQLIAYKNGKLSLGTLIGDLGLLINSLESVPLQHKQILEEHVLDLEEVYAVMLDNGLSEPDNTGQIIINDVVEKLSCLLEEVVDA